MRERTRLYHCTDKGQFPKPLLDVKFVRTDIACHPGGDQIIQGLPLLATLADLSSRDMIETWGKRTAVDALPIGGKKRIVRELKWPVAIAHNELKGSKHLAQGGFRVVIVPGENALSGIAPGQKKDLCMGRIHP